MSVIATEYTKIQYTCSEHGHIGESRDCPFCDKCPHGITRNGHCDKCNDFDWLHAPINRAEFEKIVKENMRIGPTRRSPYPRQYVVADLLPILLAEFKKMKGW